MWLGRLLYLGALLREGKGARMEFEGGGEMLGEVGPVVAAGIEVKFVRDAAGEEEFVEGFGAAIEAEIVFGAAIEIDEEVTGAGMIANDGEGALARPVSGIKG